MLSLNNVALITPMWFALRAMATSHMRLARIGVNVLIFFAWSVGRLGLGKSAGLGA